MEAKEKEEILYAEHDLFGFMSMKNSVLIKDFSNLVNFCVYNYGKH